MPFNACGCAVYNIDRFGAGDLPYITSGIRMWFQLKSTHDCILFFFTLTTAEAQIQLL